jgi:hypothetical protein
MDPVAEKKPGSAEQFEHDDLERTMANFKERFANDEESNTPVPDPAAVVPDPAPAAPLDQATTIVPDPVVPDPTEAAKPGEIPSDPVAAALEVAGKGPDEAQVEPPPGLPFDTVVRYKHNREEKEQDLAEYLRNPEKYPELVDHWQKGADYDRQRDLADTARTERDALATQRDQMTKWLEARGVIKRDPVSGQYVEATQAPAGQPVAPAVQPAGQRTPQDDRLSALHTKMERDGLAPGEIREMIGLETDRRVGQFEQSWNDKQTAASQQVRQQQEAASRQTQQQQILDNAARSVQDRHVRLKALYTDPMTGAIDEYAHTRAGQIAWSVVQSGGDVKSAINLMDVDARTYHSRAQNILSRMKGTQPRQTSAPAPRGNGTPAAPAAAPERPAINLDAPPGKDGLAERWAAWERTAQGG